MTVQETKAIVQGVEGWLDDQEGMLLYEKARQCSGKGVIVEIGSWKGKSTIWLAAGSLAGRGVRVYAIDPHNGEYKGPDLLRSKELTTFADFEKNIAHAGIAAVVEPVVDFSEKVAEGWKKPIELLWIDGDHSYAAAKKDFAMWIPHVVPGGIIAAHDSFSDEVKRALHEEVYTNKLCYGHRRVATITYAVKSRKPVGFLGRWRANYLLGIEWLSSFARKIPWPYRARLRSLWHRAQLFLREI